MSTVEEIQSAMQKLSLEERDQLRGWFLAFEDDNWDREMAADAAAGKLDKLAEEADKGLREGRCKEL